MNWGCCVLWKCRRWKMIQWPLAGQTPTPSSEAGTGFKVNSPTFCCEGKWGRTFGQSGSVTLNRQSTRPISTSLRFKFYFSLCALWWLWTEGKQRRPLDWYRSWHSRGSSWKSGENENCAFFIFVLPSESHQLPPFLWHSGLRPDVEKPLNVLITHMHFDHSGGAHQFQQVLSHFSFGFEFSAGGSSHFRGGSFAEWGQPPLHLLGHWWWGV